VNLDPGQLILQLGLAGAILFVVRQLASKAMDQAAAAEAARTRTLSESEAARTKAITEGFAAITGRVEAHHTADIQSHGELAKGIAEIKGQLDEARWHREEFTPIGPIPQPVRRAPSVPNGVRLPRPGKHHDED